MGSKSEEVVYGAGSRKPSTGGPGGEQAGPLPSRSSDRNVSVTGNLVTGADNATRKRKQKDSATVQDRVKAVGTNKTAQDGAGTSFKASSSKQAHLAPSKVLYRQYRSALRTFDRISAIPVEDRKESQIATLEWAAREISRHNEMKSQAKPDKVGQSQKRQRSLDESPKEGPSKKRMTSATTYRDVILRDNIVVAVLDRGNPDGTISGERWRKVECALSSVFLEVLKDNPGPAPRCRDAGWHQGRVKLIACKDQRSVDLYKIAISKIGAAWPGAKLEVTDKDQIPSRPRARTWIPVSPSDPKTVMEIIRTSNPELNTADWKIGKMEAPVGESRQAVVIISHDALRPLEKSGGVISYGFMSITLKVYKSDVPKSAVPINTDSVVDPAEEGTSSMVHIQNMGILTEEEEDNLLSCDVESNLGKLNMLTSSSEYDGSSTDSTLKEMDEGDEQL